MLEAIARKSVEASHKVSCAYFGNIGRNSGGFLVPIFLAVHPNGQGTGKSLGALALLADKLKSHGQIMSKITYILSKFCPKCLRKT